MDDHHKVLVFSLNVLRCLGLSFTGITLSPDGRLIPHHSRPRLLLNLAIAAAFLLLFFHVDFRAYASTERIYKSSMIVYPLYTKLVALVVVLLSVCGNVCNRKYADAMERFRRVRAAEGEGGGGRRGTGVAVGLLVYMGVVTGVNVWVDGQLTLHFGAAFRVVHHVSFWYATGLTVQLVVTMGYIGETFACVKGALGRARVRVRGWMEGWLELREAEEAVNEVLGKQMFLTMVLAFSSAIVNVYYLVSLNLYETTYVYLNVTMSVGLFQSVVVAVVSTRAAESAAREANRVNEVIFRFLVENPQMYTQMKHFILFNYHYPLEFRVWIFYAINNYSLFKVLLTSSAVTTVILQCDFLRGTLQR